MSKSIKLHIKIYAFYCMYLSIEKEKQQQKKNKVHHPRRDWAQASVLIGGLPELKRTVGLSNFQFY